jgi:hypothetical protein
MGQARFFNKNRMDAQRSVDAADSDLFDIRCTALTRDENHGPPGRDGWVRAPGKLGQHLLKRLDNLAAKIKEDMQGRRQRYKLAALGNAGESKASRFDQPKVGSRNACFRAKALASELRKLIGPHRVFPGPGGHRMTPGLKPFRDLQPAEQRITGQHYRRGFCGSQDFTENLIQLARLSGVVADASNFLKFLLKPVDEVFLGYWSQDVSEAGKFGSGAGRAALEVRGMAQRFSDAL